jgi:hypothetical protein
MAIKFDEAFETGPDAAAITTSNSQLTSTTVPAGASVVFSSTQARGTLSAAVTTPSTYAATYMGKSGLNVTGQDVWFRWYGFYADFITPGQSPGFLRTTNAVSVACFSMRPSTTGIIQIQNGAGTTIAAADGTVPVAVNQWIRIEIRLTPGSTTGQVEWWLYNTPDSTTADDHGITSAAESLTAIMDAARIGQYPTTGHAGVTHYIDDFRISTDGKIGPGSVFVPTFYTEYMPYSDMGPGFFGPNPFVAEDYPPLVIAAGGPVSFDMGTTQAVFNFTAQVPTLRATITALQASLSLTGVVPKGQAIAHPGAASLSLSGVVPTRVLATVKPPVGVFTLSGQVPTLRARYTFSQQAILTFTANVGTLPSSPVTFNMGTTQAILNLSGILYSKLSATARGAPIASLSLTALAPKESARVFPVVAPFSMQALVGRAQTVERPGLAAMNLIGLTQTKNIVRVGAPSAILRFFAVPPFDPLASKVPFAKIRALGTANHSGSGDNISR